MTNDLFYSERETGVLPRTQERISFSFWNGFIALIDNMIAKNFFVEAFPARNVEVSMIGEIPDLGWPPLREDSLPDSLTVLDAVEFFARHVSKPTSQYDRFDRERGLLEYADHVNRLFRRNQHPFFLDESGIVKRQLPETLQPIVVQDLRSPDQEVNRLLDAAILKLQDKDLEVRREALEKLWDAWERLKTVLAPDKKTGAEWLLEQAIPSEALRNEISAEAKTLTKIGNDFRIRHSETTKYPVERSIDVDYLFHRMYSLLRILIRGLED